MATNSTQQEILILTGTTFSTRQLSEKDGDKRNLSEREQLEEACWNGLLPEMFPELCKEEIGAPKIYLWEIKEANSFIELELSEFPEKTDKYYSLDPYCFLQTVSLQ